MTQIKQIRNPKSEIRNREILYVWPYHEWGGAQMYFIGLAKLARNFYRVNAAFPSGSQQKILTYLENQGIGYEFFDAVADLSITSGIRSRIVRLLRNHKFNLKLARYFLKRGLKNTLVHADIAPWNWHFWILYFLTFFCPVVVTIHISFQKVSELRRLERLLKFWILTRRKNFRIIVSNLDMYESLKTYVPEKFIETVNVAFTGIDVDEIETALSATHNREELCYRYKIPSERFLIFTLAQIVIRKGPLVLLEAAKELLPKYPKLFFVWVGFGEVKQKFEKLIAEAGLSDSFRLIEPSEFGASRFDLLALLRLADTFVLPSYGEGLPGALLEAMALGKPSIGTSVNAIPEAIVDGKTGLLVPPGDGRALAHAIEELYQNESLRKQLSEAGRAHILKTFDERLGAETTLKYYNACFDRKS